ncbi:MAG TPA: type II secretion system ATPase GspE [bacterium]
MADKPQTRRGDQSLDAASKELADYKVRLRLASHDTTLERAVFYHRARSLEQRGLFDEAVAVYKKVLELAPHDALGYARLASLYVQRETPRAAVVVYVALAELQASKEAWDKAAHAYEKAAELAQDDSEVHSALRDVYIKLGKMREASKVQARIDRIIQERPDLGDTVVDAPDTVVETARADAPPAPAPPAPSPPAASTPRPAPAAPAASPKAEPAPPAPARPAPTAPEPAPSAREESPKPAAVRPGRARSESLGQIMLDEGLVTREQLDKAIQTQQRSGGHLGSLLVEMGAVTEQQLARVLSIQWGLSVVDLASLEIDPDVVKVVPQHLAQRHKVLAIGRTKRQLRLAIADPLNVVALDDVRLVTGLDLEPVVAASEDIVAAINRYYSGGIELDEAMRQAISGDVEVTDDRSEEISLEKLRTLVEEAPIVRLVNLIISQAIGDGASDIHLEPHRRSLQIRYRVDGILRDAMAPPKAMQQAMISRIKIMANLDIAERRQPQDGRIHVVIEGREYDLRVSTLPTVFGEKVVMRILDQSTAKLTLSKLGYMSAMLETWNELISKPYGMILVSGPTGSGKTTTLYATLNKLNTIDKNILTIEDPVEYQLARVNQVHVNPKAGLSFASGLRSFLRQDPDIIMVGEIRDKDTAEIAIQASLTGHLVLSTIHTNDAPSATTRLLDMGIEPFLITSSVIGVLAQRLARTICSYCKEPYTPPVEALHRLNLSVEAGEEIVFYRGKGCDRCKGSGYKGRTGIFELMVMTDPIRELVLKGGSTAEIRARAVAEGMRLLRDDGILKVLEGQTTVDELLRVVFVEL